MRTHYLHVYVKHLSIPANQTSVNFDNVITCALPKLVIINLVSDVDHASGYLNNPYNFQNVAVNRIDLKRNCMPRHTKCHATAIIQIFQMGSIYNTAWRTSNNSVVILVISALVLPNPSGPKHTPFTRLKLPMSNRTQHQRFAIQVCHKICTAGSGSCRGTKRNHQGYLALSNIWQAWIKLIHKRHCPMRGGGWLYALEIKCWFIRLVVGVC